MNPHLLRSAIPTLDECSIHRDDAVTIPGRAESEPSGSPSTIGGKAAFVPPGLHGPTHA